MHHATLKRCSRLSIAGRRELDQCVTALAVHPYERPLLGWLVGPLRVELRHLQKPAHQMVWFPARCSVSERPARLSRSALKYPFVMPKTLNELAHR